ncbi:MAG TPA: S41 family peptidase [Chthoniobacterales bacterium]
MLATHFCSRLAKFLAGVVAFIVVTAGRAPALPTAGPSSLGPDPNPLWMRYPAISPDGKNIAFIFRGHLFRVPSTGGQATALTAGPAHQTAPVWSPDGRYLAFASDDQGNYDIYLVSVDGGPVRRLTDHSADEIPSGFTPDGQFVVFSAHRMNTVQSSKFPVGRVLPELYRVSVQGGKEPEQILTTPALHAHYDRAGQRIVYEDLKGYEDLWRKHETYSIAHDVWLYDVQTGDHTKLTDFPGEDREPVWAPDEKAVFYLSEQSGSFNVWRLPLENKRIGQPVQITHFDRNPVRFLSASDQGDLCFGFDGELYTVSSQGAEPRKVTVQIPLANELANAAMRMFSDGVTQMALSPNGKEFAFIVRGDVYVASVEHGDTKRITNTPGQERDVSFSPDGRRLVFAAEYGRPWAVYEASIVAPKEKEPYFFNSTLLDVHPVVENGQENFQPKYSPDGKEVAYLENRTALKVMNLDRKQDRVILPAKFNYSYEDGDQWFDWSPDGKWFLVTFLDTNRASHEAGLVDAEGNQQLTNLTRSGYEDLKPQWVTGGKSMIWLTNRYGLHGDSEGQLPQVDVFGMFFTREAFDRFNLPPGEFTVLKEKEDEARKKKDGAGPDASSPGPSATPEAKPNASGAKAAEPKKTEPVTIDFKNLQDRTSRLTLASTQVADAALTPDGETLVYLSKSDKGFDLWSIKPREKELKRLAQFEAPETRGHGPALPQQVVLDAEGKNAFVVVEGRLVKVGLADSKQEPVKFAAEKEFDGTAERAYLFEHIWRQVKEKFYVENLHGVDWDYYKQIYARFLPYIDDNRDFSEMVSEMLGELNASHTGCRYLAQDREQTSALGAFFDPTFAGPGLKIQEVIEQGPLDKADVPIVAGMVIEKIDGVPVDRTTDLSAILNHKAGKNLGLTVFDPATNARHEVTVRPFSLGEQENRLYERWVKQRRELVDQLSHGTVGYVHVRGMDDRSYRDTFAEALGRDSGRKALIVDTRYNGGGNLHDELATFLSGKRYLRDVPRGQDVGWEPANKWDQPTVVLIGESNYSDGMLFPWVYRDLKLGKLVGMPVPGTGTAVWWETLPDPSLYFGIPEVGIVDQKGQFMEKVQVEPDVKVANDPKSVAEGRDLQLERAVQELQHD